jgi:serine O-acetyltransferase
MNIITEKENLLKLVVTQLKNNFLCTIKEEEKLAQILDDTVEKMKNCFKEINNKYYWDNGVLKFNPFQSDQYSIFLYFLSNLIWKNYDDSLLADKVYCLNKMLNASSADIFAFFC